MPRLSAAAQLANIKKQKAALEKKEQELLKQTNNKDLIKIVALIRKAGLSVADIAAAMKVSKRKRAGTSKLAGKKVPPKYRNPADKTQTWTGRGRMPAWAAELSGKEKLDSALIKK